MLTRIFRGEFFFIAGLCVLENEEHTIAVAKQLAHIFHKRQVAWVFKASFDKANRTAVTSYRGPGLEQGLRIMSRLKREMCLSTLVDIHLPNQAQAVAEVADILQIPAFLCRQTDLLLAAAETGRAVNVKKGQFLAPADMHHVVQKLRSKDCNQILLTERGTCFGYHDLVVDFRSIPQMQAMNCPVVFDATHSVQQRAEGEGVSGGAPQFIPTLARAAVAAGADGIFLEVHPQPHEAKSDGANCLPLGGLEELVDQLLAVRASVKKKEFEKSL